MRRAAVRLTSLAGGGWLLATAAAGQPRPVGPELLINGHTTASQREAVVAGSPGGGFLVAWTSSTSPGDDDHYNSVQARRFEADGTPVDEVEFQVNGYTTNYQETPSIAVEDDGDFVVVWESYGSAGSDSSGWSIQGQRYAAGGAPLGAQFQVNTYTTFIQLEPDVAPLAGGGFVVVWESYGSNGTDHDGFSVQGQRFDADGAPVDGQFQLNSYTTAHQDAPAVAADAEGGFVVAWTSDGSDGTDTDSRSIQAARFDADGLPAGGPFQVNSYTTGFQSRPAVAVDADGGFVVVWRSPGSSGTDHDFSSIQGQRYDADDSPRGGEFQVNSYTTGYQALPAVAFDVQGDFLVGWTSDGADDGDAEATSVQAQLFRSDGSPLGAQFRINSATPEFQIGPGLALDGNGRFVAVWTHDGPSVGDDPSGIRAQRYQGTIFRDGFESGDTGGWDGTTPRPVPAQRGPFLAGDAGLRSATSR